MKTSINSFLISAISYSPHFYAAACINKFMTK